MFDTRLKCIEFFAGVGGFHYALKEFFPKIEVLAALDINTVTNTIYKHNFPDTKVFQRNIQALSSEFLDGFDADIWTLSPPCQPFTRKGNCRDVDDSRCDALTNLCAQLRKLRKKPAFIMVENVCGFESSSARASFVGTLCEMGYFLQEFILSPLQLGIPNSRPRYYLLARRVAFPAESSKTPRLEFPAELALPAVQPRPVGDFLVTKNDTDAALAVNPSSFLLHLPGLNLVTKTSTRSACFTKSYSAYLNGCGSLVVSSPKSEVKDLKKEIVEIISATENGQKKELVESLAVRYFSWREIANLFGFPDDFGKPSQITNKQMYRALGNSISVYVVSLLLKYLLSCSVV